jgi:hypothetical protein
VHRAQLVLEVADALVDGERPSQSCLRAAAGDRRVSKERSGGIAGLSARGLPIACPTTARRASAGTSSIQPARSGIHASLALRRRAGPARRVEGARARRGFGVLEYTSGPMHIPTFRSRGAGRQMYPRDPAGHRVDHFWPILWGLSGRSTPSALVGVPGVPQTSATPNVGLRTHDFRSFAKNAI